MSKIKGKTNLISSILFLLITILIALTSTFAWLLQNDNANSNMVINATSYDLDVVLKVCKNAKGLESDNWAIVNGKDDLQELLERALPGDKYGLKLQLKNKGADALNGGKVTLKNIQAQLEINENISLLDVFYIDEGKINISSSLVNTQNNGYVVLDCNSTALKYFDEDHHEPLNLYRLANLIDSSNDIVAYSDFAISPKEEVTISFDIYYDSTISIESSSVFENNQIKISYINIWFD